MRRFRRALMRAVVALAAIGAFVVGTASPAMAAIDPEDWQWNPTICRGCANTNTNLVRFWQTILWADDAGISGTGFIDGQFGPNTESRTKSWQGVHKDFEQKWLVQDGKVGRRTWWSAQWWGGSVYCNDPDPYGMRACTYYGEAGRNFNFETSDRRWYFYHPATYQRYVIVDYV